MISPKAAQSGVASPVKTFHYSGWTQDRLASTLTLKITPGGSIEGVYTVKGKSSPPGQPCWTSARIPYRGHLTGMSHPAAKGTLEAAHVWCPGNPNGSGMDVPAEIFRMWFQKGKGLILDIGNQHYRVVYSDPFINPFSGVNGTLPTGASTFPAGKWQTTFGTMILQMKNGHMSGTYTHDHGRITGTMRGRRLVCQWFEAPTYRPAHDAGECYFNFSDDGRSFTGKWRYGFGTGRWDGDWTGRKIEEQRMKR